ncbi:hypothetical protein SUGI_0948870 [Cryptomeria japonica]|nr:hypothetical protein SUGI_0948870 [Cryptomeria japonica]
MLAVIFGPQLLSLPFAFASFGWGAGIVLLALEQQLPSIHTNLSLVLEHLELKGNGHLRFSDMTTEILGIIEKKMICTLFFVLNCYLSFTWRESQRCKTGTTVWLAEKQANYLQL